MSWVQHLVGAEDSTAAEQCVTVAESEIDNDRPIRAVEIIGLMSELTVDQEVKKRVLRLAEQIESVL